MNTLQHARLENAVETVHVQSSNNKHSKQRFDFLLVLDFEATCWNKTDYNKGSPEIIEFPCVLYDLAQKKIVAEFQQYVMPFERPNLSPFCTELTGIEQAQVDNGVPLKTALLLFQQWLNQISMQFNLTLSDTPTMKQCAFSTWSDWDLGTCLYKECRRKRIKEPDIFAKWIDARAIYKAHYLRRPKGLFGALTEIGLTFEGTQHCGLHDARNTAKLLGRMAQDGALLVITKDISNKLRR